jgi:hypothetical protein
MSLVLGLSGVLACWPPGWGWIGIALALAGCAFSFRGFADVRTTRGDLGYNIAGFILGSWGVVWGAAMQIKHAGGAIDALLLPLPVETLSIAMLVSIAVFWASAFASRRIARAGLLALAAIALLAVFATASSALVLADRIYVSAGSLEAVLGGG